MEIVGLVGDRVRLVPPERMRHADNAYRWFNDPAVTCTLGMNFGASRRSQDEFLDRIEQFRNGDLTWAIHDETDRHIGFISLQGYSLPHRTATGSLVIGARDAWGRGYATDAVRTRTRFAFEQVGLHRIEGQTISPAMCRVYDRCGYQREGTARHKHFHQGRWYDAALYAILKADYVSPPAEALPSVPPWSGPES